MNQYDDYEHTKKHQEWVESQIPSWQEVSEAIERADSEHCAALDFEKIAAEQEDNQ